jgi:hypothetical protein
LQELVVILQLLLLLFHVLTEFLNVLFYLILASFEIEDFERDGEVLEKDLNVLDAVEERI